MYQNAPVGCSPAGAVRFQITEYDCGTVSLHNAISYLFERETIPAELVKTISMYTLDERVGYGLPITEDEYYSMVSYINIMYTLSGNKSISMYDEKMKKKVK